MIDTRRLRTLVASANLLSVQALFDHSCYKISEKKYTYISSYQGSFLFPGRLGEVFSFLFFFFFLGTA